MELNIFFNVNIFIQKTLFFFGVIVFKNWLAGLFWLALGPLPPFSPKTIKTIAEINKLTAKNKEIFTFWS